jgi:hypothetical protein
MNALSASGLADLAGTTKAEVQRLVDLGILVARPGPAPFRASDVQKVRLATACEQAGLPMDGIASAIRAGRLSFAFLEASPYRRWALRSARTYRQVSQETGVPLDQLRSALESMGFARTGPDEPIREDELEVMPLLQLGLSSGVFDLAWLTRLGRGYADGLRLAANVEKPTAFPGAVPECPIRRRSWGGSRSAVHIAARVMGAAGPGEILTSGTVRDLVVGPARSSKTVAHSR